MMQVTLTSKGQITLPKAMRDALNLKAGDTLVFSESGNQEYRVKPRKKYTLEDLASILPPTGRKSLSVKEMDEAIGQYLSEKHQRISEEWSR